MAKIPLTKGFVAIVDDEDFEFLSQWKWCAMTNGSKIKRTYAVRSSNKRLVYMHRVIVEAQVGYDVDHFNDDTLDNRRSNLRIATRKQNIGNKRSFKSLTGYRGVTYHKQKHKYAARCYIDCVQKTIGLYDSAEAAARAYDEAAKKEYGEFARLNFG